MFEKKLMTTAVLAAALHASAETLRDPMRPYGQRVESPKTGGDAAHRWQLSAVLFSDGRRVAIVNGRTVGEGDRLGSATVRRIFRRGLELDVDGRSMTLRLNDKKDAMFNRSGKK